MVTMTAKLIMMIIIYITETRDTWIIIMIVMIYITETGGKLIIIIAVVMIILYQSRAAP